MQVGAADRATRHLDDGVSRMFDLGIRNLSQRMSLGLCQHRAFIVLLRSLDLTMPARRSHGERSPSNARALRWRGTVAASMPQQSACSGLVAVSVNGAPVASKGLFALRVSAGSFLGRAVGLDGPRFECDRTTAQKRWRARSRLREDLPKDCKRHHRGEHSRARLRGAASFQLATGTLQREGAYADSIGPGLSVPGFDLIPGTDSQPAADY